MHMRELQSFIFKFHQLWKAGVTARLDLETHAGQAWVGLRVQLGHVHQHQHGNQQTPRRSPAYYRRQERRKTAKAEAPTPTVVATSAEKAVKTCDAATNTTEILAEVAEENLDNCNENAKKADLDVNPTNAEKALSCDSCERTFRSFQGLKKHVRKKHKTGGGPPIPQMDSEDDKYSFKREWPPITPTRVPHSSPPETPILSTSPRTPLGTPRPSSPRTPPGSPPISSPNQSDRDQTIAEIKAAIRELSVGVSSMADRIANRFEGSLQNQLD